MKWNILFLLNKYSQRSHWLSNQKQKIIPKICQKFKILNFILLSTYTRKMTTESHVCIHIKNVMFDAIDSTMVVDCCLVHLETVEFKGYVDITRSVYPMRLYIPVIFKYFKGHRPVATSRLAKAPKRRSMAIARSHDRRSAKRCRCAFCFYFDLELEFDLNLELDLDLD